MAVEFVCQFLLRQQNADAQSRKAEDPPPFRNVVKGVSVGNKIIKSTSPEKCSPGLQKFILVMGELMTFP